jgi:hypothetical protein
VYVSEVDWYGSEGACEIPWCGKVRHWDACFCGSRELGVWLERWWERKDVALRVVG